MLTKKNILIFIKDWNTITIQFYIIKHNSQIDRWIKLEFYQEFPNILFYVFLS